MLWAEGDIQLVSSHALALLVCVPSYLKLLFSWYDDNSKLEHDLEIISLDFLVHEKKDSDNSKKNCDWE